ncbi:ketoacyl-ACP synthase III [Panacibacter ginsenosidivorans]|uniref:Beta-ketoacyl-[acyl-carrier-protein] synthase III n=1 Tax=Panacibacter ginsenosidivorans TaxID=1813871 RepID=A0A5B8V4G7_9BACT|nr:beta-ketoacyl-ACP synthase III [Panacibacter ginsenosidivorans]QEC66068.1 ketoacyl-ACP synthase III [Panacibacter ginsenosidivorans]
MTQTKIAGIGMYVPANVVTNNDLAQVMDTSDAWILERTGITQRRYATRFEETSAIMGVKAAKIAIENAGITAQDIDFIVFATLSPDYYFPGCGVLLQRMMNMKEIAALDIRNQCTGFIYGLSIADQFVKTGMYKNVLLVGAEVHSYGLDFSNKGRNVSVIFGDGAGAVVLQPASKQGQGILSTHLHSNGNGAEVLSMINPGFHGGCYNAEKKPQQPAKPYGNMFITPDRIRQDDFYPFMDGQSVFKKAVEKFPEVIQEALQANGYKANDINMLIPHQANLRISQFVQHKLQLRDDQVYNNIQRYGNTTAASIPIALYEAWQEGKIKEGNLVCLAAFGSGYTWGSALIRW